MNSVEIIISTFCGILACGVVLQRKPHYACIWLFLCGLSMALVYGLLNITHLGAMHAMMIASLSLVLILLVFMLDNFRQRQPRSLTRDYYPVVSGLLGAMIFGIMILILENNFEFQEMRPSGIDSAQIFQRFTEGYPLVFELAGLLLFCSLVGILYLLKKERT